MAVRIRLSRHGRKKQPFYWVVVADVRAPRDGRFIEKVGTYNPLLPRDNPMRISFDRQAVEAWQAKGAQMSERVAKLFAVFSA